MMQIMQGNNNITRRHRETAALAPLSSDHTLESRHPEAAPFAAEGSRERSLHPRRYEAFPRGLLRKGCPSAPRDDGGWFRKGCALAQPYIARGRSGFSRWGAILCVLCASAVNAQSFHVTGTIVDARTNAPLAKTQVGLTVSGPQTNGQGSSRIVVTGTDGRFRFDSLPPGKYNLNADHRGYPIQALDQHEGYNTAVIVGPNLDTDNILFRLRPAAVIAGHITDEMNEPVRNANVLLFQSSLQNGKLATRMNRSAQTDDQGAFRFSGLLPGKYYVGVTARPWYAQYVPRTFAREFIRSDGPPRGLGAVPVPGGYVTTLPPPDPEPASPLDMAYPATFYPNATDSAGAGVVQLRAGERVVADIAVRAVPGLHLRINHLNAPTLVAAGPGAPPPPPPAPFNLMQRFFGGGPTWGVNGVNQSRSGNTSEFSGLAPGRYVLRSQGRDGARTVREFDLYGDMTLDVGDAESAAATVTVTGAIKFDGDLKPDSRPSLLFRNDTETHNALIKPDGTFESRNIPPGEYQVSVNGAQGFLIWGLAASGATVDGQRLEIAGDQPVRLSVVATKGVGAITGYALHGEKPAPGIMVMLVPQNPGDIALYRRDQSDTDGSFSLNNVVPGNYTVLAIAEGWDLEWSNPNVLRRYLPAGTPLLALPDTKPALKLQVQ